MEVQIREPLIVGCMHMNVNISQPVMFYLVKSKCNLQCYMVVCSGDIKIISSGSHLCQCIYIVLYICDKTPNSNYKWN